MTCIIGLECSDGAVIGGDYCGSNGFTYHTMVPSKVFSHSGMIFGYTSTFRFGQIVEHMLDNNSLYPPHYADDTYRWLVKDFVPKLQKLLREEEYPTSNGCSAVMVINGQVWELQGDMSVLRNDLGLVTVGSGTYHAESSVMTQLQINFTKVRPTIVEATEILERAFLVTSSFVSSVSAKCNILEYQDK